MPQPLRERQLSELGWLVLTPAQHTARRLIYFCASIWPLAVSM